MNLDTDTFNKYPQHMLVNYQIVQDTGFLLLLIDLVQLVLLIIGKLSVLEKWENAGKI